MKYLKMLGLAAVAAAALMAFVGAGTASATVICKTQMTEGCAASGWAYPAGTEGTASLAAGTTAVLETTAGETLITCTESVVKSTLANAGSATTTVESGVSSITFGSCSQTVDTLKGGSAVLHWIAGTDNGTLTTFGTRVTVQVFGVSCVYGPSEGQDVGNTIGGNPGSMTLSAVFNRVEGGFLCPADARFTGKYVATSPTNAWVAAS